MTAFFGLTVIFIVGIAFLFSFSPRISLLLKAGLAFPAGFGVLACIVFIYDLLNINYNFSSSILALFLVLAALILFRRKEWSSYFKQNHQKDFLELRPQQLHLPWLLFFACLVFVVYGITAKTLYWPTTAYDSITGYDYVAKVLAAEGGLDNSINNPLNYTFSLRTLYPPLVPIAFSFAYICGLATSKIISSLFFISVLTSFYGFLRYCCTHFNAIVFTLLLAVIPEFLAMSALSLSNVPSVAYTTAGAGFLILFFRERKDGFLWLSALMMAFAIFTRTEGIVYAAAAGIVLLFKAIPEKKWSWIALYAIVPLLFFVSWELYVKYVWELSEFKQPFIYKIFLDGHRLSFLLDKVLDVTFNTQYFGITVYLFLISVVISIPLIYSRKQDWQLLVLIILSWALYVWVFYQMDIFEGKQLMAGGGGYIASGYKRGFFNFCALFLMYAATVLPVRNFFKKWLT